MSLNVLNSIYTLSTLAVRPVGGGVGQGEIVAVDRATNTITLTSDIRDIAEPLSFYGTNRLVFGSGTLPALGTPVPGAGLAHGAAREGTRTARGRRPVAL